MRFLGQLFNLVLLIGLFLALLTIRERRRITRHSRVATKSLSKKRGRGHSKKAPIRGREILVVTLAIAAFALGFGMIQRILVYILECLSGKRTLALSPIEIVLVIFIGGLILYSQHSRGAAEEDKEDGNLEVDEELGEGFSFWRILLAWAFLAIVICLTCPGIYLQITTAIKLRTP